jgi:hypothetical protein
MGKESGRKRQTQKSLNIRKYSSIFNMGIGEDFKYTKKHVCNPDPNVLVNIQYAKKHEAVLNNPAPNVNIETPLRKSGKVSYVAVRSLYNTIPNILLNLALELPVYITK